MCGISGLIQAAPEPRLLNGFISASRIFLNERGPDQFAYSQPTPELVLIHSRLSIIDIASGNQPMTDGANTIVYNGEIYNYQELRNQFSNYSTHSDTEVLLKGLARYGLPFLNQADGMFAFAYFKRDTNELILARDAFGIKPLYYFSDGQNFAFASRLQPLMLLSKKEIDRIALTQYYATRACRTPRTIFSDVKELKPGHSLVFDLTTFRIKSIERWANPFSATRTITNEAEAIDSLEQALKLSVKRHLVSDVPVATFLSGGVDSGLITAMAAQINPTLSALSIGFRNPRFDESHYAADICKRYNLQHHVLQCDHNEFMSHIDKWPSIMDDVVADPSAVMLSVLSQFAKELGYKVVLSGEGADEIFAGYNQHYRFLLTNSLYRFGRFLPFANPIARALIPHKSRYLQLIQSMTVDPHYYGTGRIFEHYLLPDLFEESVEMEAANNFSEALALDLEYRLPDDILTRTDRATMHNSIEARVPFLTRYVWDVAGSLSEELLIKGKTQKYLLKKLTEKYIPYHCIHRKKVGFDLPLADWLRGPLKEYMMDNLRGSWQADYLRKGVMESVVSNHLEHKNDNADKIWAFLLLENNVKQLSEIYVGADVAGAGL